MPAPDPLAWSTASEMAAAWSTSERRVAGYIAKLGIASSSNASGDRMEGRSDDATEMHPQSAIPEACPRCLGAQVLANFDGNGLHPAPVWDGPIKPCPRGITADRFDDAVVRVGEAIRCECS